MKNSKLDAAHRPALSGDALRAQRIALEQAKKDAGIWGELSVGIIEHRQSAFVYVYKGLAESSMHRLAAKRPKEISKADHEALCQWLKAGGYDGFKQRISAWNISVDEAERVRKTVSAELSVGGLRVIGG